MDLGQSCDTEVDEIWKYRRNSNCLSVFLSKEVSTISELSILHRLLFLNCSRYIVMKCSIMMTLSCCCYFPKYKVPHLTPLKHKCETGWTLSGFSHKIVIQIKRQNGRVALGSKISRAQLWTQPAITCSACATKNMSDASYPWFCREKPITLMSQFCNRPSY